MIACCAFVDASQNKILIIIHKWAATYFSIGCSKKYFQRCRVAEKCVLILDKAAHHTKLNENTKSLKKSWTKAKLAQAILKWGWLETRMAQRLGYLQKRNQNSNDEACEKYRTLAKIQSARAWRSLRKWGFLHHNFVATCCASRAKPYWALMEWAEKIRGCIQRRI